MTSITKQELEVFNYLNEVREDGQINMFGAAFHIEEVFDLDKRVARELLQKWMKNFNSNGYKHLPISNT